mmetsp:Transcript_19392/g.33280  ORF Transcript_19392/g.33280 Transcript_19392/m.33280 type:complete len:197 (-) Transcript_19392:672-1262(-)
MLNPIIICSGRLCHTIQVYWIPSYFVSMSGKGIPAADTRCVNGDGGQWLIPKNNEDQESNNRVTSDIMLHHCQRKKKRALRSWTTALVFCIFWYADCVGLSAYVMRQSSSSSSSCRPLRDLSNISTASVQNPNPTSQPEHFWDHCLKFQCEWKNYTRCDTMSHTIYNDTTSMPCCVHILRDMANQFDQVMCKLGLE